MTRKFETYSLTIWLPLKKGWRKVLFNIEIALVSIIIFLLLAFSFIEKSILIILISICFVLIVCLKYIKYASLGKKYKQIGSIIFEKEYLVLNENDKENIINLDDVSEINFILGAQEGELLGKLPFFTYSGFDNKIQIKTANKKYEYFILCTNSSYKQLEYLSNYFKSKNIWVKMKNRSMLLWRDSI